MSVHRYQGPIAPIEDLSNFVASVLSVTTSPGTQIDVNLSVDANKPDLDEYMASKGFEFLVTSPIEPPLGVVPERMFGAGIIAIAGTEFLLPGFSLAAAVGAAIQVRQPYLSRYRKITVRQNVLGVGAGSLRYTFRVAGIATTLTVDVPVLNTGGSFTVSVPVEVAADAHTDLRVEKIGVIVAAAANVVVLVA